VRLALLITAVISMGALPARAEVGGGDFDVSGPSSLSGTGAKPISQVGDDAIRISATPALGGKAWVIELHRQDADWALGDASFGFWGRGSGWTSLGHLRIELRSADYAALSKKVDALLARGEPAPPPPESGWVVVCTDGPGYLSERRKNGKSTWMSGFCGEHPNNAIARLMMQVVWKEACTYRPAVPPCFTKEVPASGPPQ
jgi:hypothetical protein